MSAAALLDLPVDHAVAQIVTGHLDAAAAALAAVGKAGAGEALHDFRVAVRRTRSALRAYRPWLGKTASRKLRRRLRDLARATNAGRDAEVQIAWLSARRADLRRSERAGLNWLLRHLRDERRGGYARARREVRAAFARVNKALRTRFDGLEAGRPEPFRQAFGTLLMDHATEVTRQLAAVRGPDDQELVHEARLAAKRLRYLLEPVVPALRDGKKALKRLKGLQEILGALHDMHVLATTVAGALKRASAEKSRRMHELALAGQEAALARERRRDERLGLVRLAQFVRRERDDLYAKLVTGWNDRADGAGGARALAGLLRQEGAVLAIAGGSTEIERKYVLAGLPDRAADAPPLEIDQGWLPGELLRERVRRVKDNGTERYFRTLKLGSGLQRVEIEESTDPSVFAALWPLTVGRRVAKRRYRLREAGLTWEIDVFRDRSLVLAEVELPSPTAEVTLPDWLAPLVEREVTGDPAFDNVNLAG